MSSLLILLVPRSFSFSFLLVILLGLPSDMFFEFGFWVYLVGIMALIRSHQDGFFNIIDGLALF